MCCESPNRVGSMRHERLACERQPCSVSLRFCASRLNTNAGLWQPVGGAPPSKQPKPLSTEPTKLFRKTKCLVPAVNVKWEVRSKLTEVNSATCLSCRLSSVPKPVCSGYRPGYFTVVPGMVPSGVKQPILPGVPGGPFDVHRGAVTYKSWVWSYRRLLSS